jgi:anti-sigma regulatory factor (Ser/Thr protein kinase)
MPATSQAGFVARTALTHAISSRLAGRLDDAKLVITEVVTNAVRHGADGQEEIRLVIESDERRLYVEVEQTLTAHDVHLIEQRENGADLGGFGLRIVEALADGWGVEPGPPGRVWFEFRA